MARKATKDQKDQVEALSYIDSLVTILGDYPETLLPLTMNVNPFGFLIDICKSLGIFDELLQFLVKTIQYKLPLIELGVKGILLANIKELVSCSSDPFIPNYLRKQISSNNSSGITFTLSDLDYNNLMQVNPLAQGSEYNYLGIPRHYVTTYKIIAENATTLVDSAEKNFKDKDKAKEWMKTQISKFTTKYKNNEDFQYIIEPKNEDIDPQEIPIIDIKKNKKTRKVTSTIRFEYQGYVSVTAKANDANAVYIEDKDTFETYQEATSHILSLNKKYEKTYSREKGYFIDSKIEQKVLISSYELARAKDFNAFLWFIVHLANFNQPQLLRINDGAEWLESIKKNVANFGIEPIISGTPLGILKFKTKDNASGEEIENASNLLGTAFAIDDGQKSAVYHLCLKSDKHIDEVTKQEKGREYTLVPATSDQKSLNWYADRSKYFDFLKYWGNSKKEDSNSFREYDKEIGICNIEFDENITNKPNFTNFNRNQLRFTILPKPMYHTPQILDKDTPFNFKKLLFDSDGKYNKNGKFSIFLRLETNKTTPKFNGQSETIDDKAYIGYYEVISKGESSLGKLWIPKGNTIGDLRFEISSNTWYIKQQFTLTEDEIKKGNFNHIILSFKFKNGILEHIEENCTITGVVKNNKVNYQITLSNNTKIEGSNSELNEKVFNISNEELSFGTIYTQQVPISSLYECYPNLTIYEFNYDYIMSQRLFDPKVVAGELIQSLLNVRLGASGNLGLSINHTVIDGRLRQVVMDMVQSNNIDAFTVNDCFNSFSNAKYDQILSETEIKKAQGFHLEGHDRTSTVNTKKIEEILNDYDNPDITQEGQVDILKSAFEQAMVSITEGTDDVEVWDVKFNIILQLIIELVFCIIKSLLTPKILMIIAVNKQLMGDDTEWTGNVLENLLNVLMKIITQIIKEITKTLLDNLLKFVLDFLKPKFAELMALVIKEYFEQYKDQLIALITACGFGWGSGIKTADTAIDTVTYADIDPIEEVTDNKEC